MQTILIKRLKVLRHSRHYYLGAALWELRRDNKKEIDKALSKIDELQTSIEVIEAFCEIEASQSVAGYFDAG